MYALACKILEIRALMGILGVVDKENLIFFRKSCRKIWQIQKKSLPLHSLFGTEVSELRRKHRELTIENKVQKKVTEKIWSIQKFAVTLQSFSVETPEGKIKLEH